MLRQRMYSGNSVLKSQCFEAGSSIGHSPLLVAILCSANVAGNHTSPSGGRVSVSEDIVCEPFSLNIWQSTAGLKPRPVPLRLQCGRLKTRSCWFTGVHLIERSSWLQYIYGWRLFVHQLFAGICGHYRAHRRTMIGAERKEQLSLVSKDRVVLVIVAGVIREGVDILPLSMVMTRLVFVTVLLRVFMAEGSVTLLFQLLQSHLHIGRPCLCVGDKMITGEADPE